MNLVRPADVPELASLMTEFDAEAGLVLERAAAEATFRALIDARIWARCGFSSPTATPLASSS